MALFYGWDLTASRLEPLRGGSIFFYLPLSSQKFLVLILLTWKDERPRRPWKPPSGFEHETPGLGTQRLSWSTRVVFLKASELFSTFESVFFLKVWFFVQQKAWILWLWSVIILFKVKIKEKSGTLLLPDFRFLSCDSLWIGARQKLNCRRIF